MLNPFKKIGWDDVLAFLAIFAVIAMFSPTKKKKKGFFKK